MTAHPVAGIMASSIALFQVKNGVRHTEDIDVHILTTMRTGEDVDGAVQTWGETSNSLPVGRTFLSATGASGGQDCALHRVVTQL